MPFIAGFMALIGGALTFLNGRLNEAKTKEARQLVLLVAQQVILNGLTIIGAIFVGYGVFTFGFIMLLLVFILNSFVFINTFRHQPYLSPTVTGSFVIVCSVYSAGMAFLASFHVLIGIVEKQEDEIGRLITIVENLAKSSPH